MRLSCPVKASVRVSMCLCVCPMSVCLCVVCLCVYPLSVCLRVVLCLCLCVSCNIQPLTPPRTGPRPVFPHVQRKEDKKGFYVVEYCASKAGSYQMFVTADDQARPRTHAS